MADRIIVYWRDIPAQVIIKSGRKTAKRELPLRFTEAIDMCAMRSGAHETDAYWPSGGAVHPSRSATIWKRNREAAFARLESEYGRIGFGNWSLTAAGRAAKPAGAYQPSHVSVTRRLRKTYTIRLWSVRHARFLEIVYRKFASLFLYLHPVWKAVGYQRAEAPVKFVERRAKGLLFDCRMCGQCILSSTGMSCPMNCPKRCGTAPAAACGQRQLRGGAGHAVRLGAGLGGQPPHAGRRTPSLTCSRR
jgi:hypothetical protein